MRPSKQPTKGSASKGSCQPSKKALMDAFGAEGQEDISESASGGQNNRTKDVARREKSRANALPASDAADEEFPRRQELPFKALYPHVKPYTSDRSQRRSRSEDEDGESDKERVEEESGEEGDDGEDLIKEAAEKRASAERAASNGRQARQEALDAKEAWQVLKNSGSPELSISESYRKAKDLRDKSRSSDAMAMELDKLAVEAEATAKQAKKRRA